jgi:hypothetical protein
MFSLVLGSVFAFLPVLAPQTQFAGRSKAQASLWRDRLSIAVMRE